MRLATSSTHPLHNRRLIQPCSFAVAALLSAALAWPLAFLQGHVTVYKVTPGVGLGTPRINALRAGVIFVEVQPPVAVWVIRAVIDVIIWGRAISPQPLPKRCVGQANPIVGRQDPSSWAWRQVLVSRRACS